MQGVTALIVAGGNGSRMNTNIKKQFILINDIPIIVHTVRAFLDSNVIDEIVVVTADEDIPEMFDLVKQFDLTKVTQIVAGGETRTESVKNGLMAVNTEYVAIHDGVRPCIKQKHIKTVVEKAKKHGSSALGVPVRDTLKSVSDGDIKTTVDREGLWQIQTPQCFKTEIIKDAYEKYDGQSFTDDCQLLEVQNISVKMVEGDATNIKITTKDDLELAKLLV